MNWKWMLPACLWMAAGTAGLYGQAAEGSLSFGAFVFTDKNLGRVGGDSLELGDGFRLSARLNINSWRFFGHEIGYGYNRSKLVIGPESIGMAIHQGFYDFVVHALPEGTPVRPFVCAGGGFSSFFPPGASVFSGNGITKFGYNYGAGVKARVSSMYGIRFDIRDYVTGKPNFGQTNIRGQLHNVEVSAGFAILF